MYSVSLIICAHTELRYSDILEAVASVQRQTVLPQEVIVVIDHNKPLLERLQQALGSTVMLMENRYEQGLSGARNSGIETATAKFLYLWMMTPQHHQSIGSLNCWPPLTTRSWRGSAAVSIHTGRLDNQAGSDRKSVV